MPSIFSIAFKQWCQQSFYFGRSLILELLEAESPKKSRARPYKKGRAPKTLFTNILIQFTGICPDLMVKDCLALMCLRFQRFLFSRTISLLLPESLFLCRFKNPLASQICVLVWTAQLCCHRIDSCTQAHDLEGQALKYYRKKSYSSKIRTKSELSSIINPPPYTPLHWKLYIMT